MLFRSINPEYSLEGLKLKSFGHLMQRISSLEKTLMLGKIEDSKGCKGCVCVCVCVFSDY